MISLCLATAQLSCFFPRDPKKKNYFQNRGVGCRKSEAKQPLKEKIIAMFVRVFRNAFSHPEELTLSSIRSVCAYRTVSKILTQTPDDTSYSWHPADIVRQALMVYAALLNGREEMQIHFPPFALSNLPREPQSVSLLRLDLTKEQIEITEETAPVDVEGNIQLDATQTRLLRTFSYNKELARKKAETTARENAQIGQTIPGKGIFAGLWTPKDRDGNSLGKTFSVFAAPEDLTDGYGSRVLSQFKEAAQRITALRNWHGHDGGDFANDAALYRALADGSAVGKWFIPTQDLLTDHLYANKSKIGGLQTNDSGRDVWYWSCTEHPTEADAVRNIRFSDGNGDWNFKHHYRLSCRPCRVEAFSV